MRIEIEKKVRKCIAEFEKKQVFETRFDFEKKTTKLMQSVVPIAGNGRGGAIEKNLLRFS